MSTSITTFPCTVAAATTVPAATVPPTDPTLVGKAFRASAGNAVELAGFCSAGAGKLYLLRWDGDEAATVPGTDKGWRVVDLDANDAKALVVDSAKPAVGPTGLFSGTWMTGDTALGWYLVMAVGGPTLAPLRVFQRRL